MKKWLFPSAIALIFCFSNCQNHSSNEAQKAPISDALANTSTQDLIESAVTSTPSVSKLLKADSSGKLTNRKIIRTASVKSKVNNTEQATYKIEQVTKKFGGFISQSNLESRVTNEHETPVSTDSVMKISAIQVSNNIVLRVPNQYLDSFLVELSTVYTFLDTRKVSADDVTHNFLSNQLKAQIRDNAVKRIQSASDNKGKTSEGITEAENSAVAMKDAAIDHEIANLETNYNIQYSQVNLEIYQDDVVMRSMKLNPSVLDASPSVGYRLMAALRNGGSLLVDILIGIVNMWAIIGLSILAWWVYRKYRHSIHLFINSKASRNI